MPTNSSAPDYQSAPLGPTYDEYTKEMLKRTGRAGSQEEYGTYYQNQPGWQQGIETSPEAIAYGQPPSSPVPPSDPYADVNAWIGKQAGTPGINPSVGRDPGYWNKRIGETGGLNASNEAYWKNLMMRPEGAPENWQPGDTWQAGPPSPTPVHVTGGFTSSPVAPVPMPSPSVGMMPGATGPQSGPLFDLLMQRANQSLAIDRNDPIIRDQSDAFNAQQTRASRDYLSGVAERAGTNANIGAETRRASEQVGQASGAFEAQLIGQELTARRQEIQAALSGAMGFLTDQQQLQLQDELARLELAERQSQFSAGQGQQESQYARDLAQREAEFGRKLTEQEKERLQQESQFGRNLSQRGYEFDTTMDYRYSPVFG